MELKIPITNNEDIEYINKLTHNKESTLQTALSIGIKALSMTTIEMNGCSYYEPLQECIKQNNNREEIEYISSILEELMNIKQNSSRKGKLGESLAINTLNKKYTKWRIEDVTGTGHEGDCVAYSDEFGKILYEIKTYKSNVNNEEILKFKNDVDHTNSLYGIFISQTSGIVGKKMIDIEIYNNKLLIYVSNSGLNGHGIELATELLIQLINSDILQNQIMIYNDQSNLNIINDILYELGESMNNYTRLISSILESKTQVSKIFDDLYKKAFKYELEAKHILSKITTEIKLANNPNHLLKDHENIYKQLINRQNEKNNILYIEKIYQICNKNNVEFSINDNNYDIIYLIKKEKLIGKFVIKSKLELVIDIVDMNNIQINGNYEKIKGNTIIIQFQKNSIVLEIINKHLNNISLK